MVVKMPKIFISHSKKDKPIVNFFVDDILIGGLGIKIVDIFCTSIDGSKIKSGEDWRNDIKDALQESKVTFLIITPNYKSSEICQNEMGAAWVLSCKVIPLIVEPITYTSCGILQEPKQIEKLTDEGSLDRIKDILQEELGIPPEELKSDRWSAKKHDFLSKIKKHLENNPFEELEGTFPDSKERRPRLLHGEFIKEFMWSFEECEEKRIEVDLDGDGAKETILLGRDHPNGTRFYLIKQNKCFPMDIPVADEFDFPKEGHYFHIAILDVNGDLYPEIICAVGNGSFELFVEIWAFDHHLWNSTPRGKHINPMKRIARFEDEKIAIIQPGGKIIFPADLGPEGIYQWDGKEFKNLS
uniref:TIR domain-containing protein n=1 Tax=candidate division CPR3 bacterium TaxID=2268181 RepID=A0A7V3J9B0_UNCC3